MWGDTVLNVTAIQNFFIGFSNAKTDILIHLGQWQYWWWFWFSFLWALYYLLITRTIKSRTLKFRPRLATTFRPHGKWGDLIVCLIPISWCANIISNSNLILRMIEWQSESALFTVRVRGKQWYWVYKFDLKSVTDTLTATKNVGRDKWIYVNPVDLGLADKTQHLLQLRSQNKWTQKYWTKELVKSFGTVNFFKDYVTSVSSSSAKDFFVIFENTNFDFFAKDFNAQTNKKVEILDLFTNEVLVNKFNCLNYTFNNGARSDVNYLGSSTLTVNRWLKKNLFFLKVYKTPVSSFVLHAEDFARKELNLWGVTIYDNDSSELNKISPHNLNLTIKQKRYKRRKIVTPRTKFWKSDLLVTSSTPKYLNQLNLENNTIFTNAHSLDQTAQYKFFKKSKNKTELSTLATSNRMLRTKRTLVLPAHVNLAFITNSYDVIHSWFIPGLGLKLDCIPGRSTHHTFYIDHVGFYYGQCAEVCGRFHHHMPIRLCALNFEHFMLWWHNFGLPKLLTSYNKKTYLNFYSFRKYVW